MTTKLDLAPLDVIPTTRRSKGQDLQDARQDYRLAVQQKLSSYHLHVQAGCIAQGLMLHPVHCHGTEVWRHLRSWLRTMDPTRLPGPPHLYYLVSSVT